MTTNDLIAQVRRLDAAATPGPWTISGDDKDDVMASCMTIAWCGFATNPQATANNAEAIAAFRTAAPALADAVEARDKAIDHIGRAVLLVLIEKLGHTPETADMVMRHIYGLELVDGRWRIRE